MKVGASAYAISCPARKMCPLTAPEWPDANQYAERLLPWCGERVLPTLNSRSEIGPWMADVRFG